MDKEEIQQIGKPIEIDGIFLNLIQLKQKRYLKIWISKFQVIRLNYFWMKQPSHSEGFSFTPMDTIQTPSNPLISLP